MTVTMMKELFGAIWASDLKYVGFDNNDGCFILGEEAIHTVAKFWYTTYTHEFILEYGDDIERFAYDKILPLMDRLMEIEASLEY